MNKKELRELLQFALDKKDPNAIKAIIRVAVADGYGLSELEDLHYPLLLLLAFSKQGGGRPKNESIKLFRNCACKVKSAITGDSFSKVWETFSSKTRPVATSTDEKTCAIYLEISAKEDNKDAKKAIKEFEMSINDLEQFTL